MSMSEMALSKDNKYTILNFPFHGAVSALRALLFMSGADYTFIHPTDWSVEKPSAPLGVMPVLYEETKTGETLEMSELSPIEFYLGKKFGYTGDNLWEENLVRMYHSSTQALFDKLVHVVVRTPKEHHQEEMMEIFLTKILPEWAQFHERALAKNGSNGHYVGNKLTLADIKTASIIDNMITLSGDKVISHEKTPAIMAVYDGLNQVPKYKEWKTSVEYKAYDDLNKQLLNV
ncbi:hypothetical protein BGZ83_010786 [Gryganskiella cystojenkinii]|nr:hypothetical protein BGZ83_010786 [Gryganskiella cystojenkinii]